VAIHSELAAPAGARKGMMSRRTQENLIAVVVVIVFVSVIITSLDFGPRARMVPLPLAVFGLILIVAQIIWQNLRSGAELKVDILEVLTKKTEEENVSEMAGGAPPGKAASADRGPLWRREAVAIGIVALFLGLILLLGPIPAVFLFTLGYLLFTRHYSWFKGFLFTVLFTTALYLLFVTALEIQLYHGILEPLVNQFR
jgi:hypothetical protein